MGVDGHEVGGGGVLPRSGRISRRPRAPTDHGRKSCGGL